MLADLTFGLLHLYSTAWMRAKCRVVLDGEENLPAAPGGRRVYMVINHSTSYDLVALMHLSARRFCVVMDEGAFHFPVIGQLFHMAGFIPLVKSSADEAIGRAVDTIREGVPLVMSLTEGDSTIGVESRPRTGGVRIACLAGADIYPVFTMVEPGRRRHLSFKGRNGTTYPYTTFRDTLYAVSFLPPIHAASLPSGGSYEENRRVADRLQDLSDLEKERFERLLADERSRSPGRSRGGSDHRVTW
jgi:1-acyl-sn-glycerol-3-phosphate acyltransferase